MPYVNITEMFVHCVSCPVDDPKIEFQDYQTPGFILEVRPSGLKTFAYRYCDDNHRQRQYRIGSYPNISTELARRDAERLLEDWPFGFYPEPVKLRRGLLPYQKLALEKARLLIGDALGNASCWVSIATPSL